MGFASKGGLEGDGGPGSLAGQDLSVATVTATGTVTAATFSATTAVNPSSTNAKDLGGPSLVWANLYLQDWRDASNIVRLAMRDVAGSIYRGRVADGAAAVAHAFTNSQTLANATAKLATYSPDNGVTEKLAIDRAGKLITPTGTADAVAGNAVLVAGTVTVNTTSVTANSVIILSRRATGGTVGLPEIGTVTAGTSFVINSVQPGTASTLQAADTSTISWEIRN
jgi:hypothetical protein